MGYGSDETDTRSFAAEYVNLGFEDVFRMLKSFREADLCDQGRPSCSPFSGVLR